MQRTIQLILGVVPIVLLLGCSHQPAFATVRFDWVPCHQVVDMINAEVQRQTRGEVERVVVFDTTPAPIKIYAENDTLRAKAENLRDRYRANEAEMLKKGAWGFETAPWSGRVGVSADHLDSIRMQLINIAVECCTEEFDEPDPDGRKPLVLRRDPSEMEIRVYPVNSGILDQAAESQPGNLRVGCHPVESVFIDVTGYRFWTIMVPDRENSWISEFRYKSVMEYIPDDHAILILDTPAGHRSIAAALSRSAAIAIPVPKHSP